MTSPAVKPLNIAIACGGTGGHVFPGLAVAGCLAARGAEVTLLISPKEVDQAAVESAGPVRVLTLPAVGLTRGRLWEFLRGFRRSYFVARASFRVCAPHAALAMGGFTSAPPLLAVRRRRAPVFLHESNTIPGRANRWLSWIVDRAFVGFPSAARRLHTRNVTVTGTPVRPQFQPLAAAACRTALGLDPARPVALVMGGSQGASGINDLIVRSLPGLAKLGPDWQWFHLSGPTDQDKLKEAYGVHGLAAVVRPFFSEMHLALGAATAAVSRAGASSLAELAAMRLPALLIPFPAATDNHQFHNARAFEETGAACLLHQAGAQPKDWTPLFGQLMTDQARRQKMQAALAAWHKPQAAEQIAEAILAAAKRYSGSARPVVSGKTPEGPVGLLERSQA